MKKFLWVFLFLIFSLFSIWVLFFSYYTQIKNIKITNDFPQKNEVAIWLDNFLVGNNRFFSPEKNLFLFSRKKMEKKINQDFPLVQKIEVEKKFPDQVSLQVKIREGVFIWCFGQQCFWADAGGQLFFGPQSFQEAEKTNYPIVLGEDEGEKHLGENVFSSQLTKFTLNLDELLKQNDKFSIQRAFSSPDLASEELRVSFTEGWQVYFGLTRPATLQIKILEELLEEKLKDVPKDKIEYIDLRLPGKVLYKLRD